MDGMNGLGTAQQRIIALRPDGTYDTLHRGEIGPRNLQKLIREKGAGAAAAFVVRAKGAMLGDRPPELEEVGRFGSPGVPWFKAKEAFMTQWRKAAKR